MEEKRQQGVHAGGVPAYGDTPLLSVGKTVRVAKEGCCRRAIIEYVNDAEGTVEVAYQTPRAGTEASAEDSAADLEDILPISAIRPLEAFEQVFSKAEHHDAFLGERYSAAMKAKEEANTIFKLKDFEAAVEFYGFIIYELRSFVGVEAGSLVLASHCGALVRGRLHSLDTVARKADVALEQETLSGVPCRTLVPMHESHLQLHSSLYMNRARGLVQLGQQQQAAQDLSVVIGFWTLPLPAVNEAERHEQLTKAYYLRAKTRLARIRILPARADIAEALRLEPPVATLNLLKQLEREVEVAQRDLVRSNKKLAKDIASYADNVFSQLSEEQQISMAQVS